MDLNPNFTPNGNNIEVSVKEIDDGDEEHREPSKHDGGVAERGEFPIEFMATAQHPPGVPIVAMPHMPFGGLASLPRPQHGRVAGQSDASLSEDIGHVDESELVRYMDYGPPSPPMTRIEEEADEHVKPRAVPSLAHPSSAPALLDTQKSPIRALDSGLLSPAVDVFTTPISSRTPRTTLHTPAARTPSAHTPAAGDRAGSHTRDTPHAHRTHLTMPRDEGESLSAALEGEEAVARADKEPKHKRSPTPKHGPRAHERTPRSPDRSSVAALPLMVREPLQARRLRLAVPHGDEHTTPTHQGGKLAAHMVPVTPLSVKSTFAPLPSPLIGSRTASGRSNDLAGAKTQPKRYEDALEAKNEPRERIGDTLLPPERYTNDIDATAADNKANGGSRVRSSSSGSSDKGDRFAQMLDTLHLQPARERKEAITATADGKEQEAKDERGDKSVENAPTPDKVAPAPDFSHGNSATRTSNGTAAAPVKVAPPALDVDINGDGSGGPASSCSLCSECVDARTGGNMLTQLHRAMPVIPALSAEERAERQAERAHAIDHDSDSDLSSPIQAIRSTVYSKQLRAQRTPVSSAESGYGAAVHHGWLIESHPPSAVPAPTTLPDATRAKEQRMSPTLEQPSTQAAESPASKLITKLVTPRPAPPSAPQTPRRPERGRLGSARWSSSRRSISAGMSRGEDAKSQTRAEPRSRDADEERVNTPLRRAASAGPASLGSSPVTLSPAPSEHGIEEGSGVQRKALSEILPISAASSAPALAHPASSAHAPPIPPRTPRTQKPIELPQASLSHPPSVARVHSGWVLDPQTFMPLAPQSLTNSDTAVEQEAPPVPQRFVTRRTLSLSAAPSDASSAQPGPSAGSTGAVTSSMAPVARSPVMSPQTRAQYAHSALLEVPREQSVTRSVQSLPTTLGRAASGEPGAELLRESSRRGSPRMGMSERVTHAEAEESRGKRDFEQKVARLQKKMAKKEKKMRKLLEKEQARVVARAADAALSRASSGELGRIDEKEEESDDEEGESELHELLRKAAEKVAQVHSSPTITPTLVPAPVSAPLAPSSAPTRVPTPAPLSLNEFVTARAQPLLSSSATQSPTVTLPASEAIIAQRTVTVERETQPAPLPSESTVSAQATSLPSAPTGSSASREVQAVGAVDDVSGKSKGATKGDAKQKGSKKDRRKDEDATKADGKSKSSKKDRSRAMEAVHVEDPTIVQIEGVAIPTPAKAGEGGSGEKKKSNKSKESKKDKSSGKGEKKRSKKDRDFESGTGEDEKEDKKKEKKRSKKERKKAEKELEMEQRAEVEEALARGLILPIADASAGKAVKAAPANDAEEERERKKSNGRKKEKEKKRESAKKEDKKARRVSENRMDEAKREDATDRTLSQAKMKAPTEEAAVAAREAAVAPGEGTLFGPVAATSTAAVPSTRAMTTQARAASNSNLSISTQDRTPQAPSTGAPSLISKGVRPIILPPVMRVGVTQPTMLPPTFTKRDLSRTGYGSFNAAGDDSDEEDLGRRAHRDVGDAVAVPFATLARGQGGETQPSSAIGRGYRRVHRALLGTADGMSRHPSSRVPLVALGMLLLGLSAWMIVAVLMYPRARPEDYVAVSQTGPMTQPVSAYPMPSATRISARMPDGPKHNAPARLTTGYPGATVAANSVAVTPPLLRSVLRRRAGLPARGAAMPGAAVVSAAAPRKALAAPLAMPTAMAGGVEEAGSYGVPKRVEPAAVAMPRPLPSKSAPVLTDGRRARRQRSSSIPSAQPLPAAARSYEYEWEYAGRGNPRGSTRRFATASASVGGGGSGGTRRRMGGGGGGASIQASNGATRLAFIQQDVATESVTPPEAPLQAPSAENYGDALTQEDYHHARALSQRIDENTAHTLLIPDSLPLEATPPQPVYYSSNVTEEIRIKNRHNTTANTDHWIARITVGGGGSGGSASTPFSRGKKKSKSNRRGSGGGGVSLHIRVLGHVFEARAGGAGGGHNGAGGGSGGASIGLRRDIPASLPDNTPQATVVALQTGVQVTGFTPAAEARGATYMDLLQAQQGWQPNFVQLRAQFPHLNTLKVTSSQPLCTHNRLTFSTLCPSASAETCRATMFGYGLKPSRSRAQTVVTETGKPVRVLDSTVHYEHGMEGRMRARTGVIEDLGESSGVGQGRDQGFGDAQWQGHAHGQMEPLGQLSPRTVKVKACEDGSGKKKGKSRCSKLHALARKQDKATSQSSGDWDITRMEYGRPGHAPMRGLFSDQSIIEHAVPGFAQPLSLPGQFPSHFVWGAGSSSALVEGGTVEGGRSLSVWDWMQHKRVGAKVSSEPMAIRVYRGHSLLPRTNDTGALPSDTWATWSTHQSASAQTRGRGPAGGVAWSNHTRSKLLVTREIHAPPLPKNALSTVHLPYLSPGGSAADFAAYSYKLYFEDVRLATHLGVDMYAFSIAWSRLMTSEGRPNPEGVLYYHNLVDALLAAGVTPLVTLYHWDLPLSLASEEDAVGMGNYRVQRPVYPMRSGPGRGEDVGRDHVGDRQLPRGRSFIDMIIDEERAANDYAIRNPRMGSSVFFSHSSPDEDTHQHYQPDEPTSGDDVQRAPSAHGRASTFHRGPFQGWLSASIVRPFVRYADLAFRLYGRRVRHWVTIQDPAQQCVKGYGTGTHAPARCSDRSRCAHGNSATEPYQCMHNMLLAHAYAAELFNRHHRDAHTDLPPAKLGITVQSRVFIPRSVDAQQYLMGVAEVRDVDVLSAAHVDTILAKGAKKTSPQARGVAGAPLSTITSSHRAAHKLQVTVSGGDAAPGTSEDTAAAERAMLFDAGWALDILMFGEYPRVMQQLLGDRLPRMTRTQRAMLLRNPVDFFGVGASGAWYASATNSRNDGSLPSLWPVTCTTAQLRTGPDEHSSYATLVAACGGSESVRRLLRAHAGEHVPRLPAEPTIYDEKAAVLQVRPHYDPVIQSLIDPATKHRRTVPARIKIAGRRWKQDDSTGSRSHATSSTPAMPSADIKERGECLRLREGEEEAHQPLWRRVVHSLTHNSAAERARREEALLGCAHWLSSTPVPELVDFHDPGTSGVNSTMTLNAPHSHGGGEGIARQDLLAGVLNSNSTSVNSDPARMPRKWSLVMSPVELARMESASHSPTRDNNGRGAVDGLQLRPSWLPALAPRLPSLADLDEEAGVNPVLARYTPNALAHSTDRDTTTHLRETLTSWRSWMAADACVAVHDDDYQGKPIGPVAGVAPSRLSGDSDENQTAGKGKKRRNKKKHNKKRRSKEGKHSKGSSRKTDENSDVAQEVGSAALGSVGVEVQRLVPQATPLLLRWVSERYSARYRQLKVAFELAREARWQALEEAEGEDARANGRVDMPANETHGKAGFGRPKRGANSGASSTCIGPASPREAVVAVPVGGELATSVAASGLQGLRGRVQALLSIFTGGFGRGDNGDEDVSASQLVAAPQHFTQTCSGSLSDLVHDAELHVHGGDGAGGRCEAAEGHVRVVRVAGNDVRLHGKKGKKGHKAHRGMARVRRVVATRRQMHVRVVGLSHPTTTMHVTAARPDTVRRGAEQTGMNSRDALQHTATDSGGKSARKEVHVSVRPQPRDVAGGDREMGMVSVWVVPEKRVDESTEAGGIEDDNSAAVAREKKRMHAEGARDSVRRMGLQPMGDQKTQRQQQGSAEFDGLPCRGGGPIPIPRAVSMFAEVVVRGGWMDEQGIVVPNTPPACRHGLWDRVLLYVARARCRGAGYDVSRCEEVMLARERGQRPDLILLQAPNTRPSDDGSSTGSSRATGRPQGNAGILGAHGSGDSVEAVVVRNQYTVKRVRARMAQLYAARRNLPMLVVGGVTGVARTEPARALAARGIEFVDESDREVEEHLQDLFRLNALQASLGQLSLAARKWGLNVRGFIAEPLLDGAQWDVRASAREGLVFVDRNSLERVPKTSFYWFKHLIAINNGEYDRYAAYTRTRNGARANGRR